MIDLCVGFNFNYATIPLSMVSISVGTVLLIFGKNTQEDKFVGSLLVLFGFILSSVPNIVKCILQAKK
jgi:hypothetical protein